MGNRSYNDGPPCGRINRRTFLADVGMGFAGLAMGSMLARDGMASERWNLLHPAEKPRKAYITQQFEKTVGPIVATTDYMRLFADQVRPYIPRGRDYRVLGTDGFGRSDTREKLREYFEVDRRYVVISALRALADEGAVPASKVGEAIKKYGIDPNKPNPRTA